MREKIASFLEGDEEKLLWEELYIAFQKGGKERVKEIIINKMNSVKEEFENCKESIKKELGGG